jgi:hypothetical protein
MGLRHAASGGLDLFYLGVQQQLSFPLKKLQFPLEPLLRYLRAYKVAGVKWYASGANINDMQLGVGLAG